MHLVQINHNKNGSSIMLIYVHWRFSQTNALCGSGTVRYDTAVHSVQYRLAHWMRDSPVFKAVELNTAVSYRRATAPAYRVGLTEPLTPSLLPQSKLITKHDYPEETHKVRTADGYILTIHRIPYSPLHFGEDHKPVALLLHGLLGSSADWVIAGPQKGLGNSERESEIDYTTSNHVY
jgi:hypothetical protein